MGIILLKFSFACSRSTWWAETKHNGFEFRNPSVQKLSLLKRMSELIFKSLDFDVKTIFSNLASIFQRIVVYIYITYRLLVSSNNKIKVEQWLFRFFSTACRSVARKIYSLTNTTRTSLSPRGNIIVSAKTNDPGGTHKMKKAIQNFPISLRVIIFEQADS